MKVSRTIADLDGSDVIKTNHLARKLCDIDFLIEYN
ncbi:hypothetical protein [Candidatus Endomicrobiellum trichonymphae]